jgi:hypothetical protein
MKPAKKIKSSKLDSELNDAFNEAVEEIDNYFNVINEIILLKLLISKLKFNITNNNNN